MEWEEDVCAPEEEEWDWADTAMIEDEFNQIDWENEYAYAEEEAQAIAQEGERQFA